MLNTRNRVHQMCHGELTATILRARWERANPEGAEFEGDVLDWEQAKGIGLIDIVDAVHAEWADMPPAAYKAQMEIIEALEQSNWDEGDWDKYRDRYRGAQEAEQARSDRMKLEAAAMTASRQALGLKTLRPLG